MTTPPIAHHIGCSPLLSGSTPFFSSDRVEDANRHLLRPVRTDPQLLHLLREFPHHLPKPRPFSRRNPFQTKAFFLDAEIRKHQLDGVGAFFGFVIALLIVTISGMAAADEDAVGPLGERI